MEQHPKQEAGASAGADDGLDGGLFEAFRRAPGESVLAAIDRLHGPLAEGGSIFLREPAAEMTRIRMRRDDSHHAGDERFRVLGELARGGIGVVYQAHDRDLNRDVALKVLRPEFAENEDVVERFLEEAQVGGQLQHPGIVPIYALTLQGDGRPGFAMKLVKGQTLASLLESNPRALDLVAIFEQVAQTIAYAHSRGVIHRDLKPANVMVGSFGEVQVVDWGFAKVLGADGDEGEAQRPAPSRHTIIATVRTGLEGSASIAGSVMGTPAYMPPEQALGQIESLDERADVFALGAILCEVLTGAPPYTGEVADQLVAASQGDLAEAHARLDASDAPEGLVALARACLAPKRAERPRDAGEVAARLAEHFDGVERRAREAELGAARARADAALSATSRKRSLVLAGVVLAAVLTGGGGFGWMRFHANARAARVAPAIAAALQEATAHEGRGAWPASVAAARRAVDLAHAEGVDATRAEAKLRELEPRAEAAAEAARRAQEDAAFLAELQTIRGRMGLTTTNAGGEEVAQQDEAETDAVYSEAFAQRFSSLDAAADYLASAEQSEAFAASLIHWCWVRKEGLEAAGWEPIEKAAHAVDPIHRDVFELLLHGTAEDFEALDVHALSDVTPTVAALVGAALTGADRFDAAVALLDEHLLRAPDDFWLNLQRADVAHRARDYADDVRFSTAAAAIEPEHPLAWQRLAHACTHVAMPLKVDIIKKALEISPEHSDLYLSLGLVLKSQGDFEAAVAALERAAELSPSEETYFTLGVALALGLGEFERARSAFERGLEIAPADAVDWHNYGGVLRTLGDYAAAVEAHRKALEIDPERVDTAISLTVDFAEWGRYREAFEASELARGIAAEQDVEPESVFILLKNHGHLLEKVGDPEAALETLSQAFELWQREGLSGRVEDHDWDDCLKRLEAAADRLRRFAASLEGEEVSLTAEELTSVGDVLYKRGDFEASATALAKAFELSPDLPDAENQYRWQAICSAALTEDAKWHEQILVWFDEELAMYGGRIGSDYALVARTMRWFREDADVRSIRDVDPLPSGFAELWAGVDALLEEATQ